MVFRSALLIGLLATLRFASYGQCVVSQDDQTRVITTCTFYEANDGLLMNRPDRIQGASHVVYLGSQYFGYPIWQAGSLEMSDPKKSIPCRIAFNLVTNEIRCQFAGDSSAYAILPDAFTINGLRFVSRVNTQTGKAERAYYMVLYAGKTRLLKQFKCSLRMRDKDVYTLDEAFNGEFVQQQTYYIQRNNGSLEPVTLSRKSVLDVLADQATILKRILTKKKLTDHELAGAVAYYDGFR
ncbi:hypothetical protein [Spirosoma validum]|uniref:DUF4468 domain-containing protein n=1 Tax=Spirosoma validum TaxID=2771355 RepID=A0A927B9M1_9BACT|nr:hypothetical protein [Spirosoma validum]MBD2757662.1 hypothetical protein [Spirosoma validum]